jgi:NADPH:quinone reductase-like Zn-dependent oxidoreductase
VTAHRIVITRTGGPEVLALTPFDPAPPGPGEVAIDVRAAGLNFADIFCRLGLYKAAPPPPFVPGLEVAGTIAAVGEGVRDFRTGDRVLAVTRFGGYTTYLNSAEEWVRPLPAGWSPEEGAAFPVAYLTAYHGLVNLGRLEAGETVVVHAAAGGVGTAACQIARALGARVIGTVGSEGKRRIAEEAGAEDVFVSRDYKVWDAIRSRTSGSGVDLIFDGVGGPGLQRGFESLPPGGRLVVYGFSEMMPVGGRRNWPRLAWRYLRTPRFSPFAMVESNRSVAGFNLIHLWGKQDLFRTSTSALMALVEHGEIRPVMGRTFPFEDAGRAQAFLQSRGSVGKVVLVRRGGGQP